MFIIYTEVTPIEHKTGPRFPAGESAVCACLLKSARDFFAGVRKGKYRLTSAASPLEACCATF